VLSTYAGAKKSYAFGEYAHVLPTDHPAIEDEMAAFLSAHGLTDIEIRPAEVTIEDCFIHLLNN